MRRPVWHDRRRSCCLSPWRPPARCRCIARSIARVTTSGSSGSATVHSTATSGTTTIVGSGVAPVSGATSTNAQTTFPSDSFPGMVAQLTGGGPGTTGVYYDDTYNRSLLPPGSSCTPGQTTGLGSEVNLAENLDVEAQAEHVDR